MNNDADDTTVGKDDFLPLYIACTLSETEIAALLLAHRTDNINAQASASKLTPLHLAARYANVQCVKLLIDNGVDKDVKAHESVTPMHMAALQNHYGIVICLLDAGADGMALSDEGRLPIHSVCTFGSVEVAELLLERYPHALHIHTSNMGTTPLHEAAIGGNVRCVEMLLKKDADTTALDNNGQHALDIAEQSATSPPSTDASIWEHGKGVQSHEKVARLLRMHEKKSPAHV